MYKYFSFYDIRTIQYRRERLGWMGERDCSRRPISALKQKRSVQDWVGFFYPLALGILTLSFISFNPILEPDTFFYILALFIPLGGAIVINAA
jgi:hypothetical protein